MRQQEITANIPAGQARLPGTLTLPDNPRGVVAVAHGSGSNRLSARNTYVAGLLQREGIATLLFDLLTSQEDQHPDARFNIELLAQRLLVATAWLKERPECAGLALAYYGASTGAAACICAAAELGDEVRAIVSRGGRPDLAGPESLGRLVSPTLLIVGGDDHVVLQLNRQAYALIGSENGRPGGCEKELAIVPGASHLFEEPGTLEQAAHHAVHWFNRWFGRTAPQDPRSAG
ncbi:dienelactone hydrolase family protein [Polaromonas sp.]|uniref:dienelactone hydrolase family protein n=1 Tax=Polaromonas sp. TaxID=1869339 RepID=UPI002FCC9362